MPRDLVTLDDATIVSMMHDPKLVEEFPFLRAASQEAKTTTSGCGRCQRRAANREQGILQKVKSNFANLPNDKKLLLKKLLDAKKVRVQFNTSPSKATVLTF